MLSKEVREALQAELEHLRIRRKKITERIDTRITALEAILQPDPDEMITTQLPLANVPPPPRTNGSNGQGLSFRDILREILSNHPNLSAPEVADHVVEMGIQFGGETPVKTRVANELFRMAERGHLIKRNARYSLPEATQQ